MEYYSAYDLYEFYTKELKRSKILEGKYNILEKIYFLSSICLLCSSIFAIILYDISKKISVIAFFISIFCLILCIVLIKKEDKLIKSQNQTLKNNKTICIYLYVYSKRKEKFERFLNDKKISNTKQKELLIEILIEKSKQYKKNRFWIIGVISAFSFPIWSAYVSGKLQENSNCLSQIVAIAIMFIIFLAFIHFTFNEILLSIFNRKSSRFYEMASFIREDLLFNDYKRNNNSLNGVIKIKKIKGIEK